MEYRRGLRRSTARMDVHEIWGDAKHNGTRLPLNFYINAFITMWTHFVDRVNTGNEGRGENLTDLVTREEFYRPMWTVFAPNTARGGGATTAPTGSRTHPDNPPEVNRQIQSLVQSNQRLQQNVERLTVEQRRLAVPVFQQPRGLPGTQLMDGHRGGVGAGFGSGGNGGGGGNGGNDNRGPLKRRGGPGGDQRDNGGGGNRGNDGRAGSGDGPRGPRGGDRGRPKRTGR